MTDGIVARVPHGGAPAGWLDLSANLNPLGPPASVRAAIAAAGYGAFADLDPARAIDRLARDSGVDAGRVVVTAGATEALRLVTTWLLRPGSRLLIVGPTYGEYHRLGLLVGATIREVRAEPPYFDPPIDAIVAALRDFRPQLVVVCDPNNPTARSVGAAGWRRLLDAARDALVLVDESFAPFRAPGLDVPLDDPRVVVVRSLTKVLAIPGLRAGFLVAAPDLSAALRSLADPWSVGSHALAAAAAGGWGLAEDARRTIAAWREDLVAALEARGSTTIPPDANFVLATVSGSTDGFIEGLAADRIAVRSCASFGLAGVVRIAVPAPAGLARLAGALDRARSLVA
ncbi:MAG TPA: histidinol-phosphate transaminase [Candidatus Limnocylindrales bacterium]|jgi:histidinol-phosphate/aromatic aminotransferase/cobyric acid decarboxylase-like protein|nr:histidinol-phosphate transaminase [Candidatus Limnocylindrales bacterium]